jgi:hypothetical protein
MNIIEAAKLAKDGKVICSKSNLIDLMVENGDFVCVGPGRIGAFSLTVVMLLATDWEVVKL